MSILSVAFLTSFCIEIEPSEQVVWLWKSPATYVPAVLAALRGAGRGADRGGAERRGDGHGDLTLAESEAHGTSSLGLMIRRARLPMQPRIADVRAVRRQ